MTNKLIDRLEELADEIKLIVAQIRKPSTVVQAAIDKAEWQRGEVEGVIEFEGKQYKKVDREAREGDVVVIKSQSTLTNAFKTGKPYKVQNQARIESDNPVHGRNLYNVYGSSTGRSPETVAVYELMVEDKPKTANQLRAEIIEKAKGFVEGRIDRYQEVPDSQGGAPWHLNDFKFVVNEAKRTVVVLCKGIGGTVRERGIAKCDPSDVFNEHIGKAIALGRALGLDVSEFEQSVQPTIFVVGQYVQCRYPNEVHVEGELVGVESQNTLNFKGEDYKKYLNHAFKRTSLGGNLTATIINDTNAQYGGVE